MKFKYSVVGDNTQENKEWLEKLGYKPNMISEKDDMLYTREYVNGWMYSGCPYMNIPNSYINCLGNPQLFQAVTAMREDSDYMQMFTDGKSWVLCKGNNFEEWYHFENTEKLYFDGKLIHKATIDEIIKRFTKDENMQ